MWQSDPEAISRLTNNLCGLRSDAASARRWGLVRRSGHQPLPVARQRAESQRAKLCTGAVAAAGTAARPEIADAACLEAGAESYPPARPQGGGRQWLRSRQVFWVRTAVLGYRLVLSSLERMLESASLYQ